MPVPPPPPPPSAVQATIPKSNKSLLQSIERGTKLRKVPDSVKNDRSSAAIIASSSSTANKNNRMDRRASQTNSVTAASPRHITEGGSSIDFQNQLMNQLSFMKTDSLGGQNRKASVPTVKYPSIRPALNQPIGDSSTLSGTVVSPQLSHPLKPSNKPQLHRAPSQEQCAVVKNTNPPSQHNHSPHVIMKNNNTNNNNYNYNNLILHKQMTPPAAAAASNRQTTVKVSSPRPQTPQQPSQLIHRPSSASQSQSNSRRLSSSHNNNNNRAHDNIDNRAPPPPPPPPPVMKSKPAIRRSSVNTECTRRGSEASAGSESLMMGHRPTPHAPHIEKGSPPPAPGPFRPPSVHHTPLSPNPAPPVPSRVGIQPTTAITTKVFDRAPPPLSQHRLQPHLPLHSRYSTPNSSFLTAVCFQDCDCRNRCQRYISTIIISFIDYYY